MNDSITEKIVTRTTLDPPEPRENLESSVVMLLHQIAHHGRNMFIDELGREKLALSHWMILDELGEKSAAATMRELSEKVGMPPSSVTGLVDILVEQNSLERFNDPDDRRVVRVRLTSSGLEHVARIRAQLMNQYRMAMQDMTQAELELLSQMYQRMLKRMIEHRQNTERRRNE